MSQNRHKLTALAVASICLIAVALSLTVDADHRAKQTAESVQQPAPHETQQDELIRAIASDRIEQLQDQTVRIRGHVADFRPEQMRNRQLQEYFEIRDALELRRAMSEEFNRGRNWQPEIRIHIPAENTTE